MSIDVHDLRPTIVPKSDQLNAEQLLGGPIIVTVNDVKVSNSKEQPVSIFYDGDNGRPYKPCLTMRKVLILAWGQDGSDWVGKSMELFNEPSVKFGPEVVGGIRIARLSDIPRDIKVSLAASKGKKAMHEIRQLRVSDALQAVLDAITTATGRDSMAKAKALAEKLEAPGDLETARAAYAKKVGDLKENAKKPAAAPAPALDFDVDAFIGRVNACTDMAMLQVMNDEAETLPDGEDKSEVLAAILARDRLLAT